MPPYPPARRTPPARPPADEYEDAIGRRSGVFAVKAQLVHEAGTIGPQKILAANPYRISAWFYAPLVNTGIIYLGGAGLATSPGVIVDSSGTNGMELEPGTGWVINDTTDAIYVLVEVGKGDQMLKFYEAVDYEALQAGRQT